MAYTNIFDKSQWCSSPVAYWTIQYEYKRSGADMQYRFYWKVWLKNSTGWFYNGLQLRLFLDGNENDITVKGYNDSQTGWSCEGTTDWYTVKNKTSGTTTFYAQLYDTNDKAIEKTSPSYSLSISPSEAKIKSATDFTDESNPSFTFENVGGYRINARLEFDGKYIRRDNITNNGAYTFSLTDAERTVLRNACANSPSMVVRIVIATCYSGTTESDWDWQDKTMTIVNANPSYDESKISWTDTDTETVGITGNNQIVQSKSALSIICDAATGVKGATIKKYEVTLNGVTKAITTASGGTVEMGKVTKPNTLTISVKVTDSRENSVTVEKEITIIPYSKPILSRHSSYGQIVCERCDENGAIDKSGTYLKLIVSGTWYSLLNKENGATVDVQITGKNYESAWINVPATALGGGSANGYKSWYDINTVVEGVTLDVKKSYVATIRCIDEFGNASDETTYTDLSYKIPTQDVCLHLGKGGNMAAFGKRAEIPNALELDEDWDLVMKGEYLKDFVVEQGTEGEWTYRKWNSGIAECWLYSQLTFPTVAVTGMGISGWYVTSVEVPLPFKFLPHPSSTCSCAWHNSEWLQCSCNEARVLVRQFCNGNSLNVPTKWVSIQVIGRWK